MELKKPKTIDELFQSKLSNYESSKKGESWQLLNHLINEQQKGKIVFLRIKTFFASLVAMGVVLFFIFQFSVFSPQSSVHNPQSSIPSPPSPINNTQSSFNNTQSSFNNTQSSINNTQSSIPSPPSPINNTQSSINNQQPAISNPQLVVSNEINTADVVVSVSSEKEASEKELNYLKSSTNTIFVYLGNDSVEASISNIGKELNSPFADYAPVINADGSEMYFTSRRPVTKKEKKNATASSENIYYTTFDANNKKWITSSILPTPINDPKRFNSVIAISNDGQRMLLYRDDKYGNGDIFESVLNGKTWSNPEKLPAPINSEYMESSASISPDGRTIFFVSNRPGGQGGLDIWSCTKNQQGQWGNAKNLGSSVNSTENEEGVSIHPDGKTLYFSSRGHKGLGGYDIFSTTLENGNWSTPKNLGAGINSPGDDVYFVMEANGKVGYYSSTRKNGEGEKDIYRIEFSSPEKEKTALLTLFKGLVIDKTTNLPLDAEIEIIDLEKNEQITTLKSNAASGSFLVSLPSGKNYGINVKKEGYLFYSENMNIPIAANYKEIIKTVLLDKLKAGAKIVLKNIFYDYNKSILRSESINELNRLYELLIQNPQLKVELSAHTDSRGNNDYNNKLSQERAQSCVDYLIKKGISEKQVVAKGYGKQQPLITDVEINNIKTEIDKETAHQQNRRTEFTILEN